METEYDQLDHLDPVHYLPTNERTGSDATLALAEDILAETHPNGGFVGARRSALASAALYVSAAACGDRVTQREAADACGSTEVSLRTWMSDMASLALTNDSVSLTGYLECGEYAVGVARARLQHLAADRNAEDMPEEIH